MSLNIPLIPAIFVCSGIFLIVIGNITFYSILGEINGKRDPSQKIGMFFVNTRAFEVMRLHKELFPTSRKRLATYLLGALGIALLFSIFLFGS